MRCPAVSLPLATRSPDQNSAPCGSIDARPFADHAKPPLDLPQSQHTGIRRQFAAVEPGDDGLAHQPFVNRSG